LLHTLSLPCGLMILGGMMILRAWALLAAAAAMRLGEALRREEEQARMVPALVSQALRRALRDSKDSFKEAERVQANVSTFREVAKQKELEAKNKSQETEQMLAQLNSQKQVLEAQQREVTQLMTTQDKSQEAWRTEAEELAKMQANLTEEDRLYAELQKKVQKQIAELVDMQLAADMRLRGLQAAYEKKQESVDKLREDAVQHGSIARNASQAADAVQANLAEAMKKVNKQKSASETFQKVFLQAKMDVDMAERLELDAQREVAEKDELRGQLMAARDALQTFYDNVDNLTRSLEPQTMVPNPTTKPDELLRQSPHTRVVLNSYNDMTSTFRRLFVKSKETYRSLAGGIPEVDANADAAIRLICDPFESIEEAAVLAGNESVFEERCGSGLWHDLKVEKLPFPSLAGPEPSSSFSSPARPEQSGAESDEEEDGPDDEISVEGAGSITPPPVHLSPQK